MAGKLTKKHMINNAELFIDSLVSTNTNYYMFASNHTPWDDEQNPPSTNTTISTIEHMIYDEIIFGKKITTTDVKHMIPRYDWVSNTIYTAYDKDNVDLYSNSFFVVTPEQRVYKILDNNNGLASTIKPTLVSNAIFKTSDSYVWKYMYTIDNSDMLKFSTRNYIPVIANTIVQESAIPGGIDVIKVQSGGSLWTTFNTGFLQSVVSSSELVISANASGNSNYYTNSAIYLKNGLGAGQIEKIVSYDGTTKTVILENDLDVAFNLELSNTSGSFLLGDLITQDAYALDLTYLAGAVDVGDTATQSVTGAVGSVYRARPTSISISLSESNFVADLPITFGDSNILGTGTITCNTTSNTVTGNGTFFSTFFPTASLPHYIQVGDYFRRIVSIQSNTSLTISGSSGGGFDAAYSANVFYKVPSAATVSAVNSRFAYGTTVFSDLNSVKIRIGNRNSQFVIGENVNQPGTSSNGTVVFSNNSTLILSNIQGPGFQATNSTVTFTVSGYTSSATANVVTVTARPSITVNDTTGTFRPGAEITTSTGSSGKIRTISSLPDEDTEYVISPRVNIDGDGSGALAYSVVNTTNYSIQSIIVIDQGTGYTEANVTITANSTYGNGANVISSIGPVNGHGYDPIMELGANYIMISTDFNNAADESYDFPGYGKYRTVGLIKNPLFDDVTILTPTANSNFKRATLIVNNATGSFLNNEIIYQANTDSSAKVLLVSENGTNTTLYIDDIRGSFSSNNANDSILGLQSGSVGNTRVHTLTVFQKNPGTQVIYQQNTGAKGILVTRGEHYIEVTNASGTFSIGEIIYDTSTNTYSNSAGFSLASNTKPTTFSRFSQLGRITLASNTQSFQNNETIQLRSYGIGSKLGDAVVYSNVDDIDLTFTGNTIPFSQNETITQNTSEATGIMRFANSTYMKLTNISGQFSNQSGYFITGSTSGANSAVSRVYPVLVISDVDGTWATSNTNYVIGVTSGANGYVSLSNTIIYPELVRDSGEVLYIENREYIERTPTTKETVRLLIKF